VTISSNFDVYASGGITSYSSLPETLSSFAKAAVAVVSAIEYVLCGEREAGEGLVLASS
jgi:hypothetical protein